MFRNSLCLKCFIGWIVNTNSARVRLVGIEPTMLGTIFTHKYYNLLFVIFYFFLKIFKGRNHPGLEHHHSQSMYCKVCAPEYDLESLLALCQTYYLLCQK